MRLHIVNDLIYLPRTVSMTCAVRRTASSKTCATELHRPPRHRPENNALRRHTRVVIGEGIKITLGAAFLDNEVCV